MLGILEVVKANKLRTEEWLRIIPFLLIFIRVFLNLEDRKNARKRNIKLIYYSNYIKAKFRNYLKKISATADERYSKTIVNSLNFAS
jgi:hypothetical protein